MCFFFFSLESQSLTRAPSSVPDLESFAWSQTSICFPLDRLPSRLTHIQALLADVDLPQRSDGGDGLELSAEWRSAHIHRNLMSPTQSQDNPYDEVEEQ